LKEPAVIALFISVLTLTACNWAAYPEYAEAHDDTNGTVANFEDTGMVADPRFVISGSFSSGSDSDYYKVALPAGTTKLYLTCYYNDKEVTGLLGISLFPVNFTEYNDAGDIFSHLLVGAVAENPLALANASYVLVHFYGNGSYASGAYRIELFGGN